MASEKKDRAGAEEKGNSIFARSAVFFPEAWRELKKVHAPTREETAQFTVQVLVVIAVFASFLGVVDLFIGWLMREMLT
jgi:preprotein translocase subunit SecE